MAERGLLINAAKQGDLNGLILLLDAGVDVDSSDGEKTALLAAAENSHETCCEVLIDRGADLEACNRFAVTVLMHSGGNGMVSVCRLLAKEGARLDSRDGQQRTALHHASSRGKTEACRCLIEAGANTEAVDIHGNSPLMAAAKEGHTDTVALPKCRSASGQN